MDEPVQAKHVDERGVIRACLFLDLPAYLYSSTGNFYRVVRDEEDLRQFFADHQAAGANCDVEACVEYYLERQGQRTYGVDNGPISARSEKARLMLDERFSLY